MSAPYLLDPMIAEMGLSAPELRKVAEHLQGSCPFPLALGVEISAEAPALGQ